MIKVLQNADVSGAVKRRQLFLVLSLLIGGFGLLAGCGSKETIQVSGSSTVLPIVSRAGEEFTARHGEVRILVNAGGSGVGINQVGEGTIDVGMVSRDLTADEIRRYPGVQFRGHVIAKDAVIAVVSSEIYEAGVKGLTIDQLARIYRGEIRNWREVGGPDREILVVDKELSRGTRHAFMKVVMGDPGARAPGADLVLGSNNEEQTAVAQSSAAVGMLSYAWLNNEVRGLAIIDQDGLTIRPDLQTIREGRFPITRELILVTNGEPQGWTRQFIEFILGPEGQKIVEEAGYVRIN